MARRLLPAFIHVELRGHPSPCMEQVNGAEASGACLWIQSVQAATQSRRELSLGVVLAAGPSPTCRRSVHPGASGGDEARL
jgi:hypothetical protein